MEMAHVRYFLAVCRERNITRAARRCGVAQPSLSRAIKLLELEVGGPLFRRLHGGVELTELGAEVKPYIEAIERCVEAVKRGTGNVSTVDRRLAREIARNLGLPAPLSGDLGCEQ